MPPDNVIFRQMHRAACAVPPVIKAWRRAKQWSRSDPLPMAVYQKVFERGRLKLPVVEPESLGPAAETIQFPANHPLFAGEDAPLHDLLFLLNLAKGRQARRILEVGTYRARTTYAFHLNCPTARVVSYDIQVLDSPFRRALRQVENVQLRHASFSESSSVLLQEPPFDFIFVDGSHQVGHVIDDSRLALKILARDGIVIWHDYRLTGYATPELRVPEGLETIRREHPVFAVAGTTCAVAQMQ
jgi:predicted O-methyltransferase YrrM